MVTVAVSCIRWQPACLGWFTSAKTMLISSCVVPGVSCHGPNLSRCYPSVLLRSASGSGRSDPAAILLASSPPVSQHSCFFFFFYHRLPSPPSLSLSVCLSSSHLLNLSPRPCHTLHPVPPPSLQPCAPSPTSPDGFPLSGKQAYKAFAAVPRSLAVLEPPQVGRWRLGVAHNHHRML